MNSLERYKMLSNEDKSNLTIYSIYDSIYDVAKNEDINISDDIMSLCAVDVDGMPKAPYSTSDRVLDSVIKLQEDSNIKEASKEIKIVNQAIELISKNAKYIFKHQYQLGQDKWDIINEGMSEGTYKRRHSELVYAVHKEIKKVSQK